MKKYDYLNELIKKYGVLLEGDTLKLYKEFLTDIEFIEGTEKSRSINKYNDFLNTINVKYGDNKESEVELGFHLTKYIGLDFYSIRGIIGDIFFFYNDEFYVIYDLDVDEIDDETLEFKIACFGKEKVDQVLKLEKGKDFVVPDDFYHAEIEPDYKNHFTRFSSKCDPDVITIAIGMINQRKEDYPRTRKD